MRSRVFSPARARPRKRRASNAGSRRIRATDARRTPERRPLRVRRPADVDVEARWSAFTRRMERAGRHAEAHARARRNATRPRSIMAGLLAAAAAICRARQPSRTARRITGAVADASPRTMRPAAGQRDSITLADGSRVILGPDSRLTVPGDYGTTARSVELRGDGYFDVRHDAAKPFTVRVGHAVVEDIGTTFTVESDAGDTTTVSVVSGSVRLRASDSAATSGAVLAAGDRGSIDRRRSSQGLPERRGRRGHGLDVGPPRLSATRPSARRRRVRAWYGRDLRVTDRRCSTVT